MSGDWLALKLILVMRTTNFILEKSLILCLFLGIALSASAKKREVFTVKQGDPLVIVQEKKSAVFEIDYSKMIVTDGKDHDNDMIFREWMIAQNEDSEKWLKDWEEKDSAECHKSFREHFNDEVKKGFKLTKLGKDYKVILRFSSINFGKGSAAATVVTGILFGGRGFLSPAIASGEIEVRDKTSDEVLAILAFDDLVGEERYTQISRIKGIFENLCEELSDFLKKYEKAQKKKK